MKGDGTFSDKAVWKGKKHLSFFIDYFEGLMIQTVIWVDSRSFAD